MKESLISRAEGFCEESESPVIEDADFGRSTMNWGGADPLCGIFRLTDVTLKFKCVEK